MYYKLRTFLGTQEKGTNHTQKSRETGSSREAQPGGAGRWPCWSLLWEEHTAVILMNFWRLKSPPALTAKISPGSGHRRRRATCWTMPRTFSATKAHPVGRRCHTSQQLGRGNPPAPGPLSSHLTKRRRSTFPSSESTWWGALEAAWAESTWGPDAGPLQDEMRLEADRCPPSSNPAAHQQGFWVLTQTFSLWGVVGNAWARGADKDKGTRDSKHPTFRPPDQMNENLTSSPRCLPTPQHPMSGFGTKRTRHDRGKRWAVPRARLRYGTDAGAVAPGVYRNHDECVKGSNRKREFMREQADMVSRESGSPRKNQN